ncbi:putative shikimate dehydrogenase [Thomasclavelia spiroformis DSM 1552]|uniref:Quinate/shikimate dehydrogenase (NAD(+)) n=2 Tax=Thomasclavelia spiroformis TaxID=29348 RepID=B1BZP6_9FIRM|nr:putative shikimate dehydrogenase [Thomasclavelia spiroformis DSM 1552]
MHNLAFKELNIDSVYLAFDIKSEQLKDTIKSFKILKVEGSNVSMPHKEAIIPYLDEISTASRLCNAVNTIKLIENRYYGTITDGIGFIKAINEQGWDIVNKKITIVGAGGACKAIMVQMALDGASEIIVYNRSKKAEFIKIINNTIKETNCKIKFKLLSDLDSLKQDMHNSYLFINTTGVGMEPMLDQSVVPDESYFSSQLKVADIIYQPATTKLLQMAKNAGCKVMNGELMLLYQGAESFKIWTGKDMPIDKVKKVLGIGVKK